MTDRRFQPGNRVFDSRFGRGTYVGPYEDGPATNPPLHLVHFDGEGKPMLAFEANLEPVDEEASC